MKFELSNEEYQRLFGDRQHQIELLEYSYQMMEDALRELAKDKDMKLKQEILDHLSKTIYTHNARRSIAEWMLQHHVVDCKCQIKFANHVYNHDGVRMTEGLSFEDFDNWLGGYEIERIEKITTEMLESYPKGLNYKSENKLCTPTDDMTKESAKRLWDAWDKCVKNISRVWNVAEAKIVTEDFQIGDWVKYIPEPGESSTECIEAIAHGANGEMYLCLSSGEYVLPCYCVKYKAQGEERRKLIDKLNEML